MRDIHERRPADRERLLDRLLGRVVPEVAGEVDIRTAHGRLIQQAVARTPAERDAFDESIRIPGDAHPARRRRQDPRHALGEGAQRLGPANRPTRPIPAAGSTPGTMGEES